MKLTTLEVYGLRCILRIARSAETDGATIHDISEAEGISEAYTAKILRLLRLKKLVNSVRGKNGGYVLAEKPEEIRVGDVIGALGGRLYESDFCLKYLPDRRRQCEPLHDCTIRSLWYSVQASVDALLNSVTLRDVLTGNIPYSDDPFVEGLHSD